jgi:hypothetical protein
METTTYHTKIPGFMEKESEEQHMKEPEKRIFLMALWRYCEKHFPRNDYTAEYDSIAEENLEEYKPEPSLIVKLMQPYAGISTIIFVKAFITTGAYTVIINRKYHTTFKDISEVDEAIKTIFDFSFNRIHEEIKDSRGY